MRRKPSHALLAAAALALSLCSCHTQALDEQRIQKGKELTAKVEGFRREKGRLPDSLGELGVEEIIEGPLYYTKSGETSYTIHFGTTLGESVIYNSDTKEWR
jgi:hypothetical protein